MAASGPILNIPLPDDLRRFIEDEAARAGFQNVGEYVCAVLRDLKAQKESNGSAGHPGGSDDITPVELALRIGSSVSADEWSNVPADLSRNVDHNLYGAPHED